MVPLEENPAVKRFREIAKELSVVLPTSFFERAGNAMFNTIVIIDADGSTKMTFYGASFIADETGGIMAEADSDRLPLSGGDRAW